MLNNFANLSLRKKIFSLIKNGLNFCILKRKPCMNLNFFCIFDRSKYFLHKLQLAMLFSIKFLIDWCYFFTIFCKKFKKFDYYNENIYTNSYFQMHLSCWGKRFRERRKNIKCSIINDLSEYIIFSYYCKLLGWYFKLSLGYCLGLGLA